MMQPEDIWKKRCFLVIGAENSGTRMLTAAFIAAGCEGDAGHEQRWDACDFAEAGKNIVWRRSLPHGGVIPDFRVMVKALWQAGYDVQPVLIYRKTDYVVAAQVRNHLAQGVPEAEAVMAAEASVRAAPRYAALLGLITRAPLIVPYEPFVEMTDFRRDFFRSLWLTPPDGMEFYNANEGADYAAVKALDW